MDFLDDPEEMTREARLAELASILAAGYLRTRRAGLAHVPMEPHRSPDKPLDRSSPSKRPLAQRLTAGDGGPQEDAT